MILIRFSARNLIRNGVSAHGAKIQCATMQTSAFSAVSDLRTSAIIFRGLRGYDSIHYRTLSSKSDVRTKNVMDKNDVQPSKISSNQKNDPIDNVVSSSTVSIMNKLPPNAQLYAQLARFDKPIGTMLLLWPCLWSTALASGSTIVHSSSVNSQDLFSAIGDPSLLALFATGSFLMRGAGCTINDMWDAKYDKKVTRTATRPLASGALSYKQATAFLGLQLTGGLGVLLSMPQEHLEYCFYLGAASLPLVGLYPLMKRYTNWPQLVLGMTFNWGCFMGWAATHGSLDLASVLPLYGGSIAWTLVYDTLYAHQDKNDDAKLGLKSTALHFGENTKPILFGFSTLATGGWMLAGYNLGYIEPYYYVGCAAAGSHLFWQVATADLNNAKNLAERFKSNSQVGAIIFASCIGGNLGAML
jgi:4-hydroxybenzoate polyprenyltransferase